MITEKTYVDYLYRLKDKLFATLCLYEEEVDTFDKHFESLVNIELKGLKYVIEDLPHDLWYAEAFARMVEIKKSYIHDFNHHKLMKSELFGIMKLIDNQLKQIERK